MQLSKKRILVTGAAQGIGEAIAIQAALRGAEHVVVADLNLTGAQDTGRAVERAGAQSTAVQVDLRDSAQIREMIDAGVTAMGGLDTLINQAGVRDVNFASPGATFDKLPEAAWDAVFAINTKSIWLATKFAAPHLRASARGPSVINASSVAGLTGYPATAYSASKGAVVQLSRALAIQLAPDVRCNCYCPGAIKTAMSDTFYDTAPDKVAANRQMTGNHLIPRLGHAEEVAMLACFLASDDAAFITGATYEVDGGTMAWRGHRD